MGSSGSKPRKEQHHLPKVGSPANQAYEQRQKRREAFGALPMVVIAIVLVLILVAWLVIT